ncbi:MAG: hypothetical protein V3S85_02285 [Nitrospirales bacterium]
MGWLSKGLGRKFSTKVTLKRWCWRVGGRKTNPVEDVQDEKERTARQLALSLFLVFSLSFSLFNEIPALGQHSNQGGDQEQTTSLMPGHAHQPMLGQWEGSPEGMAYSEFNHALAGVGVVMMGLSELRSGLGITTLAWSRFLLPIGMLASGAYLMIWSDHEAWPIGSMSLAETLSGDDPEPLQHKIFAVLLLGVGLIELLVRLGRISQRGWNMSLPGFAVLGGFLLFMHEHGPHPAAHQIMIHHTIMGVLALTAASCRLIDEVSEVRKGPKVNQGGRSILKVVWALLIILIGVQLQFYSES